MVFNATFNNISVTLCWGSKEKNEHKYNKSNYNGVPKSHLVPSCRNVNRIKVAQHHRETICIVWNRQDLTLERTKLLKILAIRTKLNVLLTQRFQFILCSA
jgi:hypothetical protein